MIGEDLKPHLSQLSSSKVGKTLKKHLVKLSLSAAFHKHLYSLSLFFPPQAEAVEFVHQACPVRLQWQRASIGGPIGAAVASNQTSTELQLSPPDTRTALELASTHPTPVHRSQLTWTHAVCLHSHIRALIHLSSFRKMAVVKHRRDVGLLLIVSDVPSHPNSVEQLHTPPSH